jgi:hypothetical protein
MGKALPPRHRAANDSISGPGRSRRWPRNAASFSSHHRRIASCAPHARGRAESSRSVPETSSARHHHREEPAASPHASEAPSRLATAFPSTDEAMRFGTPASRERTKCRLASGHLELCPVSTPRGRRWNSTTSPPPRCRRWKATRRQHTPPTRRNATALQGLLAVRHHLGDHQRVPTILPTIMRTKSSHGDLVPATPCHSPMP